MVNKFQSQIGLINMMKIKLNMNLQRKFQSQIGLIKVRVTAGQPAQMQGTAGAGYFPFVP